VNWLNAGDQLAPIIDTATGVITLAWTVFTAKASLGEQEHGKIISAISPRRLYVRIAFAMAGLAIALRICQLSHLLPKSVAPIAAWAVISIGMTASSLIICGYFFTRRSSPKPLPKWLRILLKSQLGMAEQHQYRFGSWHVPAVSKIYVSRKAEYRDPYAPSGATSTEPFPT
jgi:hypothetical protein